MQIDTPLPAWIGRLAPREPGEFDSFSAYARHITGWAGVLASSGGALLVLVWWPSDHFLPVGEAVLSALSLWLWTMICLGVSSALVTWLLWRRDRDTSLVQAAFYGLAIVASFSNFSRVGGPGTPWIYAGPMVPLASLFLLVPLRRRIALSLAAWLLIELSYYAPNPRWLSDPYALNATVLTLSAACFSAFVGHVLYVLSARGFLQQHALARLATTDELTGALNRRAFLARAREETRRAARHRRPLCMVMVDLDHFKAINDSHGHAVGDVVLEQATARLRHQLRDSDLLGRLGGEEFALLLPETALGEAAEVAERLRQALAGRPVQAHGVEVPVTASFGVADVDVDDEGIELALHDADQALYRARAAGRDRVELSSG